MAFVIVGMESDIPYDYQGRKGTTNRLYVTDLQETNYVRNNGAKFCGRRCEYIKVPKSISMDNFTLGDHIEVFYNRYGQVADISPAE